MAAGVHARGSVIGLNDTLRWLPKRKAPARDTHQGQVHGQARAISVRIVGASQWRKAGRSRPGNCADAADAVGLFLHTVGGDKTPARIAISLEAFSHEGAGWSLPPLLQRVHAVELNNDVSVFRRNTNQ
jgi:hypothetical protein